MIWGYPYFWKHPHLLHFQWHRPEPTTKTHSHQTGHPPPWLRTIAIGTTSRASLQLGHDVLFEAVAIVAACVKRSTVTLTCMYRTELKHCPTCRKTLRKTLKKWSGKIWKDTISTFWGDVKNGPSRPIWFEHDLPRGFHIHAFQANNIYWKRTRETTFFHPFSMFFQPHSCSLFLKFLCVTANRCALCDTAVAFVTVRAINKSLGMLISFMAETFHVWYIIS